MNRHALLVGELTALLRSVKELHLQVVEAASVPCEPAAAVVLGRLADLGPVRLTVLASHLGLDPSSVSRQVAALERAGLVVKCRDDSDLRAWQLLLTDQGQHAVTTLRAAFAARLADLTPGIEPHEIEQLTKRLSQLNSELAAGRSRHPELESV